jgi:hypothetical protein
MIRHKEDFGIANSKYDYSQNMAKAATNIAAAAMVTVVLPNAELG